MPVDIAAIEVGELVEGGGESSPRAVASFEELWRNTVVGGVRGVASRGYRG